MSTRPLLTYRSIVILASQEGQLKMTCIDQRIYGEHFCTARTIILHEVCAQHSQKYARQFRTVDANE
jgi:hypothetical protein